MAEGGTYVPIMSPWQNVPHYYGDVVRQCFVVGAIVMLVGAPFYTNDLRQEFPFVVLGALILVAFAALTNPHNKGIIVADAVASGVVVLVYQAWALFDYQSSTWAEFALREVIALILITGFYFSMKTLRAMLLHQIGKHEEVGEFDKDNA